MQSSSLLMYICKNHQHTFDICHDARFGQVNISEECRERVLATDVTAYDIFDEARTEVLTVMEVSSAFSLICFLFCFQLSSFRFYWITLSYVCSLIRRGTDCGCSPHKH